jgi:hypothetical protein
MPTTRIKCANAVASQDIYLDALPQPKTPRRIQTFLGQGQVDTTWAWHPKQPTYLFWDDKLATMGARRRIAACPHSEPLGRRSPQSGGVDRAHPRDMNRGAHLVRAAGLPSNDGDLSWIRSRRLKTSTTTAAAFRHCGHIHGSCPAGHDQFGRCTVWKGNIHRARHDQAGNRTDWGRTAVITAHRSG